MGCFHSKHKVLDLSIKYLQSYKKFVFNRVSVQLFYQITRYVTQTAQHTNICLHSLVNKNNRSL